MLDKVFAFTADHPALPGHFPGDPLVPGAALLDRVIAAIAENLGCRVTEIRSAKFLRPLRAEETCYLQVQPRQDGALTITCTADNAKVMTAVLAVTPEANAP